MNASTQTDNTITITLPKNFKLDEQTLVSLLLNMHCGQCGGYLGEYQEYNDDRDVCEDCEMTLCRECYEKHLDRDALACRECAEKKEEFHPCSGCDRYILFGEDEDVKWDGVCVYCKEAEKK